MISLVVIYLGTLLGILYFFINLFNIRDLDMGSSNYFTSLNEYGCYLTSLVKSIMFIYVSSFIFSGFLLAIQSEKKLFSDNSEIYLFSFLAMTLCFFALIIIGYIYIKYNFLDIETSLQENRLNTNNTEYEFMCKNDLEFFTYKCCICLVEKNFNTRAVIIPCNHQSFCKDCGLRVGNLNSCPLCRGEIRKITIYIKNIL